MDDSGTPPLTGPPSPTDAPDVSTASAPATPTVAPRRPAPAGRRRLDAFYEPLRLRGPALAGLVVGTLGCLVAFFTVLGRQRVTDLLPHLGLAASADSVALVGGGAGALLGLAALVLAIRALRRVRRGADGPVHRPIAGFAVLAALIAIGLGAGRPLAGRAARAWAAAEARALDMTGRPVDELLACLREGRSEVRRAAALELRGRPDAEPGLLAVLADGDDYAQSLAAERLTWNGCRAPALIAWLKRGLHDETRRGAALEYLIVTDIAGLPATLRALADPDPEIQRAGRIAATGLLLERWERPGELAGALSTWLARHASPDDASLREGVPSLADLLDAADIRVRALAQLAGCLDKAPQHAALLDDAARASADAIWAAAQGPDPAARTRAAPLLACLPGAPGSDPATIAARLTTLLGPAHDDLLAGALEALTRLGPAAAPAVPALIEVVAQARSAPGDEPTPVLGTAVHAARLLASLAAASPEAAAALRRIASEDGWPDDVRAVAAGR